MLEKTRREDINKTRKNNEMIFGIENFEEFYKGELQRDAKKEPRVIQPEDYTPKRGASTDPVKVAAGFKTQADKEADYFREYDLYKENKSKYRCELIYLYRGTIGKKLVILCARAIFLACQDKP